MNHVIRLRRPKYEIWETESFFDAEKLWIKKKFNYNAFNYNAHNAMFTSILSIVEQSALVQKIEKGVQILSFYIDVLGCPFAVTKYGF